MARRWSGGARDDRGYGGYGGFAPYVPVAERRAKANKAMAARKKKGLAVEPVAVAGRGRSIATTFWGRAWCDAIEGQASLANRLDRGRTYVRNGSVAHLAIAPGEVTAVVSGSELYDAKITVRPLDAARWRRIRDACAGEVRSSLDLLQGKLGDGAMAVLTRTGDGMLPLAGELSMRCSCPDGAWMCKHLAAVLYGVGVRLDARPELLFTLRKVPLDELVSDAGRAVATGRRAKKALDGDADALGDIFGIELSDEVTVEEPAAKKTAAAKKPAAKKTAVAKKPAAKIGARAAEATAKAITAPPKVITVQEELTTADLRARGYTPAMMKKMLADGTLEKTGYGWYRFTGA